MRSIYMMKSSHDLYKVGIAKNVEDRRKGLQTSNGSRVLCVMHVQCGNALKLEKQVHAMLEKYRQPGGREWFELTPEQAIKVCIFINQEAQVFHGLDEIQQLIDQYADMHTSLVTARKDIDNVTVQIGSEIQKAIGRLQRFKPAPKKQAPPTNAETTKGFKVQADNEEKLYKQIVTYIQELDKASTSMLQRKFRIGYGRAAGFIERLEKQGIIGPSDGARARQVLVRMDDNERLVAAIDRVLEAAPDA